MNVDLRFRPFVPHRIDRGQDTIALAGVNQR
jgi:hypothetical protein